MTEADEAAEEEDEEIRDNTIQVQVHERPSLEKIDPFSQHMTFWRMTVRLSTPQSHDPQEVEVKDNCRYNHKGDDSHVLVVAHILT